MKIRWLTAALAVVVAVAACGEMEHAPTSYTPAANRLATIGDDENAPAMPVTGSVRGPSGISGVAAPAPAAPPLAGAGAREVTLLPLGAGTLRGSVVLTAQGSSTIASVRLADGASGTSYRAAVREGSCGLLGAWVSSLLDVTVDSAGAGRSATIVRIPADSLTRLPHAIVYGKGGRPEICGDIGGSGGFPGEQGAREVTGDSVP